MERAVIWTPSGSRQDLAACIAVATHNQWQVQTVIRSWEDWVALVCAGAVDIGIIPDRSILPLGRTPRLVAVVDDQPPPDATRPVIRW